MKLIKTLFPKWYTKHLVSCCGRKYRKTASNIDYLKGKAEELHNLTSKRYFVIPVGEEIYIVDNLFVKHWNRTHKHKRLNWIKLRNISYFTTA